MLSVRCAWLLTNTLRNGDVLWILSTNLNSEESVSIAPDAFEDVCRCDCLQSETEGERLASRCVSKWPPVASDTELAVKDQIISLTHFAPCGGIHLWRIWFL